MATINIFVPGIHAKKFSGGLLCIFEYANALAGRGHQVNVIPVTPSGDPQWFDCRFNIIHCHKGYSLFSFVRAKLSTDRATRRRSVRDLLVKLGNKSSYLFQRASQIENLRDMRLPPADISLATMYTTALPVHLFGSGRKFYFIQHFEPFFSIDMEFPAYAEIDALHSYNLPLEIIANSSWLAGKVEAACGKTVPVCVNAIDFSQYYPEKTAGKRPFTVLSYGGRGVTWKGFRDAAKAIQLARQSIPDLRWEVYGTSELAPDNEIASYTPLGFITGAALRQAYSNADVVLCPSWYESFPLYPIEGMACASAVITTPYGTEDYAEHMKNAWVVPAKDSAAMAAAIVELNRDPELRERLASQAAIDARNFTWERSIARMAELLGI